MNQAQKRSLMVLACVLFIAYGIFGPKNQVRGDGVEASEKIAEQQAAARDAAKDDFFTSAAGIEYGQDLSGKFESRLAHIMAHTRPDENKPKHSIYVEKTRDGIVKLLDEAWKKRGPPKKQGGEDGRDVYDIKMNRVIGTAGERRIRMVMESGKPEIITAYPVK
ncbi:MAG: hypothetical protein ACOYNL_08510 [Rickettsiales bacterium]